MALGFQSLRGTFDVLRCRSSGIRVGFDASDILGNVPGALRGMLGAARDLLGGGALLFDRGCDRGRNLVDLTDGVANSLDRSMAPPATV